MTSPEERPGESSTDLLAKLFDLRTFVGALFLIFGVIVTLVGLGASQAEIQKAADVNLSLILGIIMLVMGVYFIGWVLLKPPEVLHSHEMSEDDLPEQLRHMGLEEIPEHSSGIPPEPPAPSRRRRPPAH